MNRAFHRSTFFRFLVLGLCVWAAAISAPQGAPQGQDRQDPKLVRPQASIVIRKDRIGADLVTITLLDADYPQLVLQEQVEAMAQALGSTARGLDIRREAISGLEKLGALKAFFGTDGVVDASTGRVNLQAIVAPLVSAPPPHTLSSFLVIVDGLAPTDRTLRKFESREVSLVGEAVAGQNPALEYRIVVRTSDPEKVVIPLEHVQKPPPKPLPAPNQPNRPLLLTLVAAAGVGAGALVYFAVLRAPRRRARHKRPFGR